MRSESGTDGRIALRLVEKRCAVQRDEHVEMVGLLKVGNREENIRILIEFSVTAPSKPGFK